nr:hypothetical protein [Tanacetum cinerariifolium]
SFTIHSESALGCDGSLDSTTKANPRVSAPSDFVPQQQDQTKFVSEGLENVLTQPIIGKGASSIARKLRKKPPAQSSWKILQCCSLLTELKDLLSKFNELTKEVKGLKKQVHELEIKLPRDLKEIPTKLKDFTKIVTSLTSQVAELKFLQWELLAEFLSLPVQVLNSASSKTRDHSVLSAGQADTKPTEGEKDTNQATISQLFQRNANKNAEKGNLNKNKPQTKTTPPPNPPVITTTITQMQSPFLQPPPKSSSQPKRKHIKED